MSWITYDHLFILHIKLFYILHFNVKGTSYQLGKINFNLHKMIANNKKTFNIASFAQT